MGSGGMIYIPNFMKDSSDFKALLRFCHRNLKGCNASITDGRNL
jgi:hypothetical protein